MGKRGEEKELSIVGIEGKDEGLMLIQGFIVYKYLLLFL